MKTICLNLPDELLEASARYSAALNLARAEYIRQAIERMNRQIEAQQRAARMQRAVGKCKAADLKVNAEFTAVEHDVQD